jgi:hypothetical protein
MKKYLAAGLIVSALFITVTLFSGTASAWGRPFHHGFRGPGFGVVVAPRVFVPPPPVYYGNGYSPYSYYGPEYGPGYGAWVPGHWERRGWSRVWVPGYWR